MIKIGLQFFGGRGGGGRSGSRGGRAISGGGSLSSAEIAKYSKEIDTKAFEKTGNGVWEIAAGPNGLIGAQILDETDSSAGGYGRAKAYSLTTWGTSSGDMSPRTYYDSLNRAKTAAREEMKGWLNSAKISR